MVEENLEIYTPENLQLGYFHDLYLIQDFTMVEQDLEI
jgi:hypothetical protein